MPRLTSKFRPIHHQQLSLKPRYSAQRFQVLRSHRKNLRRWPLEATTGEEELQGNLLLRTPLFALRLMFRFFASAIESSPNGFKVEHQPAWS